MGRVSDPAFGFLEIKVNLQKRGHGFHRTHPLTPSLTTFTQLLQSHHYLMTKVPAVSPLSQPNFWEKLGADSGVVLMGRWEAGTEAGLSPGGLHCPAGGN